MKLLLRGFSVEVVGVGGTVVTGSEHKEEERNTGHCG